MTGSSYRTQYLAQTGPLLGLSLVINLDQKNYTNGGQTEQAGARLVIHPYAQSNTLYILFMSPKYKDRAMVLFLIYIISLQYLWWMKRALIYNQIH